MDILIMGSQMLDLEKQPFDIQMRNHVLVILKKVLFVMEIWQS